MSIAERLRGAGCVYAEDEAALLVEAAHDADDLDRMVALRVGGLPLEQIVGWAQFCGLRVGVEPGVFVPRRRTELLVRLAVERAEPGSVVVDLCCGSGAVALAIAAAVDRIEVYAVDVDPAAAACAARNLAGIAAGVYCADLYAPLPIRLRGCIDLLVANAPYVPTAKISLMPPEARLHEARVALDGGADGLDVHRRVAGEAARWLRPGGSLLIETSEGQAEVAARIFTSCGLTASTVTSTKDDATVVIATPA
jgi:release factor glutamine methyltransferase